MVRPDRQLIAPLRLEGLDVVEQRTLLGRVGRPPHPVLHVLGRLLPLLRGRVEHLARSRKVQHRVVAGVTDEVRAIGQDLVAVGFAGHVVLADEGLLDFSCAGGVDALLAVRLFVVR